MGPTLGSWGNLRNLTIVTKITSSYSSQRSARIALAQTFLGLPKSYITDAFSNQIYLHFLFKKKNSLLLLLTRLPTKYPAVSEPTCLRSRLSDCVVLLPLRVQLRISKHHAKTDIHVKFH